MVRDEYIDPNDPIEKARRQQRRVNAFVITILVIAIVAVTVWFAVEATMASLGG